MGLSPMQLLIILGIAILVFGTTKLRNAGKDLGGAVKGFKDAVKDEDNAHAQKKTGLHKVLDHDTQSTDDGINVDDIKVDTTNTKS